MNVAFIPVRGGSKSIPMKNIKLLAGHPLVWWVVRAACSCQCIDTVYVSTDSKEIRKCVSDFGESKLVIIDRSEETASDTATTESAMLEFANIYDFDNICLIQSTSPLVTSDDLYKGLLFLERNEADSVLSVVRQKRFIWKETDDGNAEPVNYDYLQRPRRQDFNGFLVENGAFYITSRNRLLRTGNRLSGRIKAVIMPEESYIEIDDPKDWDIVEALIKNEPREIEVNEIRMFLCDCDGTLTDGGMYYSDRGEELKKFNTRDAFGLRLLKEKGIIVGIITSENSNIPVVRGEKMDVSEVITASYNKLTSIRELCDKYGISIQNVAYIGDDLNDLEALVNVGLSFCPADACDEVKEKVDYIMKARAGVGAVREAANQILRHQ